MILNFFSKTKSINLILMGLLFTLFYFLKVIFGENNLEFSSNYYSIIINYTLFIGSFILFKFIIIDNKLTNNSDFGILFFVLLFGIFITLSSISTIVFSFFFLLLSFRKMHNLYDKIETKQEVFDSGFWIGIATIFTPISSLYMWVLLSAIVVFKKSNWRTLMISILGFLLPLFLFYTYLFFMESNQSFTSLFYFSIFFDIEIYKRNRILIPLISMSFIILSAIMLVFRNQNSLSIIQYRNIKLLLINLLITLIILLVTTQKESTLLFLLFPVSIILANFIQLIKRKWLQGALLYSFLILFISMNL